jgi:colanic acid/amylovoran biosynthesis glycosyltransferase
MPTLLMFAPAPVIELPDGEVILDIKFVEGMKLHCQLWPGQVICVLRRGVDTIPFGARYNPGRLGFRLIVLDYFDPVPDELIEDAGVVFCSVETMQYLDMPARMQGRPGTLVFTLEYSLRTRLQMAMLQQDQPLQRRLRSAFWNLRHEPALRRSMRQADGMQFNGYPGMRAYGHLNRNSMMYLDNRMRAPMLAKPEEMQARIDHLGSGGPIRLIHSGRLDPVKGAQDLIPIATALRDRKVNFTLDIFGTGKLEPEIAAGIAAHALSDRVRLHAPVNFEAVLVPHSRQNADVFLSCHRQSDPSCTYLEALGCGLPIVGYRNDMWRALQAECNAGWVAPLGQPHGLVEHIVRLDRNRAEITEHATRALAFARKHSFEAEFSARMQHLRRVAGLE